MPERRQSARHATRLTGRLIYGPEGSTRDGIVQNLSDHGALLACGNALHLPDRLTLTIPAQGMRRQAWVAWRRLDRVGLAFF